MKKIVISVVATILVLFLLAQRGFANAAILAEHRLRLRGAGSGKEFLLLTGLLLVSAFATIFAYC